eukprot:EG_transcript_5680
MQGDAGRCWVMLYFWRQRWGSDAGRCFFFGWLKWGPYLGLYCWVHPPSPADHSSMPFMSAHASASAAVLDLSVPLREVCDSPGAEGIVPLLHTCVQPPHWCLLRT